MRRGARATLGAVAIAVVLLLLLTPGSSLASGARASATPHPTASPVLTWEVPVRISNTQSSPTGTYQQMVVVNSSRYSAYINANESNVAWRYPNGTAIYAWMESNNSNTSTHTTWWLRLYNVPANSNQTVYLYVYGETSHLLSEAGPTGEAPQLSATYGGLDDGARVFDFYDNFSGNALSARWASITTADSWINQSDGLSLATTQGLYVSISERTPVPTPYVWESLVTSWSGIAAGLSEDSSYNCSGLSYLFDGWTGGYEGVGSNGGSCDGFGSLGTAFAFPTGRGIVGLAWVSSSSQLWLRNYSAYDTSYTAAGSPPALLYGCLGIYANSANTRVDFQWARARSYTPNGVMPAVTFLNLPAPASALKAIPGPTWIIWEWTDPALAQSYGSLVNTTLFVGPACGVWENVTSLGSTEFNSTGLVPSAQYCASVEVWNQNGSSFNNPTLLASTLAENVTGTTGSGPPPPPAPSGPSLRALGEIAAAVVVVAVVLVLFAWYREHKDDTVHRTRSPRGHVSRRP